MNVAYTRYGMGVWVEDPDIPLTSLSTSGTMTCS